MRPKLPEFTETAADKNQWDDQPGSDANQNKYSSSDGKKTVSIHTEIDETIHLPSDDDSLEPFKRDVAKLFDLFGGRRKSNVKVPAQARVGAFILSQGDKITLWGPGMKPTVHQCLYG